MAVNLDWFYQEFLKLKVRVEVLEHESGEKQKAVPVYESPAEQEEPEGQQKSGRRVHRGRQAQQPAGSGGEKNG